MGQASRERPARLPEKLLQIRTALGLSQDGMIKRLGLADRLSQFTISNFEHGAREPSLIVILRYARVAGVAVEVLIDDELDLPEHLPAAARFRMGVRTAQSSHKD
jgi:transcriptional regulator with XRE-family HTH domain